MASRKEMGQTPAKSTGGNKTKNVPENEILHLIPLSDFIQDEVISCPYNKVHQILVSRMQTHLTKCRMNFPQSRNKRCPYNAAHNVREEEWNLHCNLCPNRTLKDCKPKEENCSSKHSIAAVPVKNSKLKTEENWDEEDTFSPTYNPAKKLQNHKTLYIQAKGDSKYEREKHRTQLRCSFNRAKEQQKKLKTNEECRSENSKQRSATNVVCNPIQKAKASQCDGTTRKSVTSGGRYDASEKDIITQYKGKFEENAPHLKQKKYQENSEASHIAKEKSCSQYDSDRPNLTKPNYNVSLESPPISPAISGHSSANMMGSYIYSESSADERTRLDNRQHWLSQSPSSSQDEALMREHFSPKSNFATENNQSDFRYPKVQAIDTSPLSGYSPRNAGSCDTQNTTGNLSSDAFTWIHKENSTRMSSNTKFASANNDSSNLYVAPHLRPKGSDYCSSGNVMPLNYPLPTRESTIRRSESSKYYNSMDLTEARAIHDSIASRPNIFAAESTCNVMRDKAAALASSLEAQQCIRGERVPGATLSISTDSTPQPNFGNSFNISIGRGSRRKVHMQ